MNGVEMMALAGRLFPLCRSITGSGLRESLELLRETIPLDLTETPSGTPVLDWVVPDEWNIRQAWLAGPDGRRVIDFQKNNLHIVQYSLPVRKKISLTDLQPHLHSLPDHPQLIPYRTSYYQPGWGFCLSHHQREALPDGEYEVSIDSALVPGSLTYGECFIPGETDEEILISSHLCHPSLANDNLSGVVIATAAARHFITSKGRYSLRFLFAPGTIGAITWLAHHFARHDKIKHGLVLTGLGMEAPFHYKKTRAGDADIDRVVDLVLQELQEPFHTLDFSPYGYDERQYNSPGFQLPVGCLMRAPFGTYPEYHTSGDNLSFIHADSLERSLRVVVRSIEMLQLNRTWRNLQPYGEPQLGRRGLYATSPQENLARLWVLNLSDGRHSLLDIAHRSQLPFSVLADAAESLAAAGLLAA